MKNTHDKTMIFLFENGWERDPVKGLWYHWRYTGSMEGLLAEYVPIEEAIQIQKEIDPEGYSEFQLLNKLDSKAASMYSKYMDS